MNIENLKLSKNMKYEALYWALGFLELEKGIFTKQYDSLFVKIDSENQTVDFNNKLTIVNGDKLILNSHKSFVILECIDKLLTMKYKINEIILDLNNEYDLYVNNLYIKCYEWNKEEKDNVKFNKDTFKSITYSSRLNSGLIERKTSIKTYDGMKYDLGIFENDIRQTKYELSNSIEIKTNDFIIKEGIVVKYLGNNENVIIPKGVRGLASCLFWDNQVIKQVDLPDSIVSIGGDTFYNCSNLEKVNIPINCKFMGNNPFAGCPKINVTNESLNFNLIDGVIYDKDFVRLIYYPINKENEQYKIHPKCKILGKHAFYLCNNLKEVEIPESVIKLENNPFSGCEQITIINKSPFYHIINSVIYDRDYTSVVGCLNSIVTECLTLKNVKRICRNSFWNCKGIKKIILPKTLEEIGYNPFVGCTNIEFVSNSDKFIVYNNALFTNDKSKLICYPSKFAVGEVRIPDEAIILERGAFSGCDKMTNINLHNVSVISKSCFTNCNSLTKVYCSDFITYIGEWAFAHCNNLNIVSVHKDCFIDNNATLNSPVIIQRRESLSNYLIESNNIYTLNSMNNFYKGKIKSILIDPPYNSNIDYIGYKDEYGESYSEFISSRIKASYDLLTMDGFLVINIDKGQVNNLTRICKSLFYKVKVCKWEKLHPYFDKNRNINPNKKNIKYEYIIICFKSKSSKLNDVKQPYIKNNLLKEKNSKVPNIFRCFGTNSSAKDEVNDIFGRRDYFSTPKPIKLMKELIRATTSKGSIILDYFAGSGTVGDALNELNNEDNGERKFILISNNESNICQNVTAVRLNKKNIQYTFLK